MAYQFKIFLTSGTSWSVPFDFNDSDNKIEAIGAGGTGSLGVLNTNGGRGGSAGAYTYKLNVPLNANGSTVATVIATGNSASYTTISDSGGTVQVRAACGTGGNPGLASNCIPSANAFSGGTGFNPGLGGLFFGGGGGGAAGPSGAGASPSSTTGGTGGNGAGGTGGTTGNAGGTGTEFDATHGSGGGGGGGSVGGGSSGGLYGAGGGGGAGLLGFTTAGAGRAGLIVVNYNPKLSVTRVSYSISLSNQTSSITYSLSPSVYSLSYQSVSSSLSIPISNVSYSFTPQSCSFFLSYSLSTDAYSVTLQNSTYSYDIPSPTYSSYSVQYSVIAFDVTYSIQNDNYVTSFSDAVNSISFPVGGLSVDVICEDVSLIEDGVDSLSTLLYESTLGEVQFFIDQSLSSMELSIQWNDVSPSLSSSFYSMQFDFQLEEMEASIFNSVNHSSISIDEQPITFSIFSGIESVLFYLDAHDTDLVYNYSLIQESDVEMNVSPLSLALHFENVNHSISGRRLIMTNPYSPISSPLPILERKIITSRIDMGDVGGIDMYVGDSPLNSYILPKIRNVNIRHFNFFGAVKFPVAQSMMFVPYFAILIPAEIGGVDAIEYETQIVNVVVEGSDYVVTQKLLLTEPIPINFNDENFPSTFELEVKLFSNPPEGTFAVDYYYLGDAFVCNY